MRHSREHAELLLHKAQQDEFALEKLISDPASPDEIIGFHAQQAIEKTLKAVLTNSAIYYGRKMRLAFHVVGFGILLVLIDVPLMLIH